MRPRLIKPNESGHQQRASSKLANVLKQFPLYKKHLFSGILPGSNHFDCIIGLSGPIECDGVYNVRIYALGFPPEQVKYIPFLMWFNSLISIPKSSEEPLISFSLKLYFI
jgi:hypothetical protein